MPTRNMEMTMPSRLARLVTIAYGDGEYEQYENINVMEELASRHAEKPEIRYKSLTVTPDSLIASGPKREKKGA